MAKICSNTNKIKKELKIITLKLIIIKTQIADDGKNKTYNWKNKSWVLAKKNKPWIRK